MIDPRLLPELFDFMVLGEAVSPGKLTLSGHDQQLNWETVKAKGETGASSTYNGEDIVIFQASYYMASPEEQLLWPAYRRVIESTVQDGEPKALPCYHPDLAEQRIGAVCNAGIGGAIRDSQGGVTITVKFIGHKPPKPKPAATATEKANSGTTPGKDAYDPNREAKRELASVLEEATKP